MKKIVTLSLLALALIAVSCGKKKQAPDSLDKQGAIEAFDDNATKDTSTVSTSDSSNTGTTGVMGDRTIPVKLATTKVVEGFEKYVEVVNHDDYVIEVPVAPTINNKMKLKLEFKRIAEGWPNGWTSDKKISNSYIAIDVYSKKGKKLMGGVFLAPEKELNIAVGETVWYTYNLNDGHGGFSLSDEDLESIDYVKVTASDLRFSK